MRSALALSVLGLAACATPADMRQRGPDALYESARAPDIVARCVATAWEAAFSLTTPDVRIVTAPDRITVGIYNSSAYNYTVLLDVTPAGSGSRSSYYRQFKGVPFEQVDDPVQACQNQ